LVVLFSFSSFSFLFRGIQQVVHHFIFIHSALLSRGATSIQQQQQQQKLVISVNKFKEKRFSSFLTLGVFIFSPF
jgi:hypothetical protein